MTTPSWLPKPQHREGSRVEPGGLPAGGRQSGTREDLPAAGTGAESRRGEGCTETNPDAGSPPPPPRELSAQGIWGAVQSIGQSYPGEKVRNLKSLSFLSLSTRGYRKAREGISQDVCQGPTMTFPFLTCQEFVFYFFFPLMNWQ